MGSKVLLPEVEVTTLIGLSDSERGLVSQTTFLVGGFRVGSKAKLTGFSDCH